jgi:hypothetical protein
MLAVSVEEAYSLDQRLAAAKQEQVKVIYIMPDLRNLVHVCHF